MTLCCSSEEQSQDDLNSIIIACKLSGIILFIARTISVIITIELGIIIIIVILNNKVQVKNVQVKNEEGLIMSLLC